MQRSRRRTAAIALLVCVPAMVLAALPALGLRMDAVQRPATQFAQKAHGNDALWVGRVWISGTVQTRLSPGAVSPIVVTFRNPNPRAIAMKRLRIKVATISAPNADAAHPCTKVDFEIKQLRTRNLLIPAGRSTDLAGLGIPPSRWPSLAMRNRPVNQDGCKGASIKLRFRTHRSER